MKKAELLLLVGWVCGLMGLVGGDVLAGVETKAEMVIETAGGMTMPVRTLFSGEKVRTDMGETTTIMDGKSGDVTVLIHPQKMYVFTPGAKVREMAGKAEEIEKLVKANTPRGQEKEGVGKVEKTGKKEKISGYVCEEFVNRGTGDRIWLTKEGKISAGAQKMMVASQGEEDSFSGAYGKVQGFDGMPVRIVSQTPEGVMRWTLLSVEEKEIPEGEFGVPKEYRGMEEVMKMPEEIEQGLEQLKKTKK